MSRDPGSSTVWLHSASRIQTALLAPQRRASAATVSVAAPAARRGIPTLRAGAASACLFLAACATQSPPAERYDFGSVAVELGSPTHVVSWERPVTGSTAGLGMGAARGALAVVAFPLYALAAAAAGTGGAGQGAALVAVAAMVLGAAAGVVWIPVSIVGGAVTAPAREDVDAAEPIARRVVDDPGLPGTFAERCAEAVRLRSGRELVERSRAATVIEVRLVSVERGRSWNWWTLDRPFEVVLEANARIVRRRDEHVLWENTQTWSRADAVHTYAEWSCDDGAPLRAEIDAGLRQLADQFADMIFVAPRRDAVGQPAAAP
ncbi:MAG: hypothetical protein K8T90_01225 [Planctomycetes bacterium]|nr:hypothetical protein [Planctomycetota bacterium]